MTGDDVGLVDLDGILGPGGNAARNRRLNIALEPILLKLALEQMRSAAGELDRDDAHRLFHAAVLGRAFQDMPEREQLQDVGRRPFGDSRAPPGEMLDQALLRQQPQRLAQRRHADAEIGAQLLLDDLVAPGCSAPLRIASRKRCPATSTSVAGNARREP